jgi:hypothetical protein
VLLATYAAAMLGIFWFLAGGQLAARRWLIFAALFVLIHAAALRWLSYRLLGHDYPWFLQAGVAGQYVLGSMFQPSVFGVVLIVAIWMFCKGRPLWAAGFVALAGTVHATYLLPAGMLTLGFMASLLQERRPGLAIAVGGLALVFALPAVVLAAVSFGPTSPDTFAEAQAILVNVRIPHHSQPRLWLDEVAAAQIGWMLLGILLTFRTRLFLVLLIPFVLGAALTLLQVRTNSDSLALLFPWRISSILVPVATTVILTRLGAVLPSIVEGASVRVASIVLIVTLAGLGLWISLGRYAFYMADEELPVMEFVRANKQPGDLYFVPVRVPDLAKSTRGSLSSDFKPLPDKRQDVRVIPVDLQRFRLHTGAPIYVDFKSIPYKDTDVIEWLHRLRQAEKIQELMKSGRVSDAVTELKQLGVTHLVGSSHPELAAPELQRVHEDAYYRVYRVR